MLQKAIELEEGKLTAHLLRAGISVTAVDFKGETAWEAFVCGWVTGWHGGMFYIVLNAFMARLSASSVDVTCEMRCESTLHQYGEHLVAIKRCKYSDVYPGVFELRMPGAHDDSIRGLFLLLNAGCRVNAPDKFQDLPFQTSVFGEPSSLSTIPLFGEILKMLTAAGSRLPLTFNEAQKLAIFLKDCTPNKPAAELLSFYALGLLTAHSDAAKAQLRSSIKAVSIWSGIIAQLCQRLTLKNLCLSCIRMNCYPNAFVGASKLPLTPKLREDVRPGYQMYKRQFGSIFSLGDIISRYTRL